MTQITGSIFIDEKNIDFQFCRSGGPGGQNVNKVETSVELDFDLNNEINLSEDIKTRLRKLAGKKITKDGVLIITASEYRTQEQNRQASMDKLIALIAHAVEKPKPRWKTKPSRNSVEKRIREKKKEGSKKNDRNKNFRDD